MLRHRALTLALTACAALAVAPAAAAQLSLVDDFSSGTDAAWTRIDGLALAGLGTTTYAVVGGRYVLSAGPIAPQPFQFLTGSFLSASLGDPIAYADGVLSATLRPVGANAATLGVRSTLGAALTGYTFEIGFTGPGTCDLALRRGDGAAGDVILASTTVPSAGGDLRVEARCLGPQLSLKLWDVGAAEPFAPQLTVLDGTYPTGSIGVGVLTDALSSGPFESQFDDLTFGAEQLDVVRVEEVLHDAAGSDDGALFVELSGAPGTDLSGWTLRDVQGAAGPACGAGVAQVTLPAGAVMGPDGLFVVADGSAGATAVTCPPAHNGGAPDLVDDGLDIGHPTGSVQLFDAAGVLHDAVARQAAPGLLCAPLDVEGLPMGAGIASPVPPASMSLCRTPPGSSTGNDAVDLLPNACPSPGGPATGCGTWSDLGHALTGTLGDPVAEGAATLLAGDPTTLVLVNALPGTVAGLFVGVGVINAPFKGGTLVPTPDVLITGLPTGVEGIIVLPSSWPAGIPSGASLFWQFWMLDAAGPKGVAASNGVSLTTP